MDLSRFAGSRWHLGMWLSLPILLILAVTIPTLMLQRAAEHALATRQVLMGDIPTLEARVTKVEALLDRVTPPSSQMDRAREEATRRLDQAAKDSGLTVRSLKLETELVDVGGCPAVGITANVQGPLQALVKWLDAAQKPGLLIGVQSIRLKALGLPPNEPFTADISLLLFLRKS